VHAANIATASARTKIMMSSLGRILFLFGSEGSICEPVEILVLSLLSGNTKA
jgi:hypothetical protein